MCNLAPILKTAKYAEELPEYHRLYSCQACICRHTNYLNLYCGPIYQVVYFDFHVIFSRMAPLCLSDEDDTVIFTVADVNLVLVYMSAIFLPRYLWPWSSL